MEEQYNKMLRCEIYTWRDDFIQEKLFKPRALNADFNFSGLTRPNDYEGRLSILKNLLGSIGEDTLIEAPFRCDFGSHISIGSHVFINYNCVFTDYNKISIGDHC